MSLQKKNSFTFFLPFVLFLVFLSLIFFEKKELSHFSYLMGRNAPRTILPPLIGSGSAEFDINMFDQKKVMLVNFFASWCLSCEEEHKLLMELSRDKRFVLIGVNYKDHAENALTFLQEKGNPYAYIGMDHKGFFSIDWGISGVPETFFVSKDGRILLKYSGPLNPNVLETKFLPLIRNNF